jgi:hypothetical protein
LVRSRRTVWLGERNEVGRRLKGHQVSPTVIIPTILRLIEIDIYSDMVNRTPTSPDLLVLSALLFFLEHDFSQSLSQLHSVLRSDPYHPDAQPLLQRVQNATQPRPFQRGSGKIPRGAEGSSYHWLLRNRTDRPKQIIGRKVEEARGGLLRAVLLSDCAMTLLKVLANNLFLAKSLGNNISQSAARPVS